MFSDKRFLIVIFNDKRFVAKENILQPKFFSSPKHFSGKKYFGAQIFSDKILIYCDKYFCRKKYIFSDENHSIAMIYFVAKDTYSDEKKYVANIVLAMNHFVANYGFELNFIATKKVPSQKHTMAAKLFVAKSTFCD